MSAAVILIELFFSPFSIELEYVVCGRRKEKMIDKCIYLSLSQTLIEYQPEGFHFAKIVLKLQEWNFINNAKFLTAGNPGEKAQPTENFHQILISSSNKGISISSRSLAAEALLE